MAHPRRVIPGITYLITRRCYQRTFRLRPSRETTSIFKYCLALAIQKTGVELHAVCVMSNHHHLVITDRYGTLPKFLQELHRSTAKALNTLQGQVENLWAAEKCNAVSLTTHDDLIEKMAYVAANPVTAGLVEQPEEWPGLSAWQEIDEEVVRPSAYFSESGSAPESINFRVVRPPSEITPDDWRQRLRRAIDARVGEAHFKTRSQGRRFLGRAGVLARSFIERAQSFEPRRGLVPTLAAKDPVAQKALIAMQRAFRAGYKRALALWRDGARDAEFPFGTWWMRIFHGACVETVSNPG